MDIIILILLSTACFWSGRSIWKRKHTNSARISEEDHPALFKKPPIEMTTDDEDKY